MRCCCIALYCVGYTSVTLQLALQQGAVGGLIGGGRQRGSGMATTVAEFLAHIHHTSHMFRAARLRQTSICSMLWDRGRLGHTAIITVHATAFG